MNTPAEPTPAQQSAARLTAWAVDELPSASLADFEAALKTDPARQAEAEDLKAFCHRLEPALQARLPEGALRLSPAVRQRLETTARQEAPPRVSLWMPSLAAAACFAVMLGVFSQSRRHQPEGGLIARNTQVPPAVPDVPEAEILRFFSMGPGQSDWWAGPASPSKGLASVDQRTGYLHPDDGTVRSEEVRFSVNYDFGTAQDASPTTSAESYRSLPENPFLPVAEQPLSTFSIDVDTASYAIARRHLNQGQRPPVESVRLEEMINYFPMDDAPPADDKPFAVHVETASAPWAANHRLVRVALKGKVPAAEVRGPAHLVFLVDTSGSMGQPNKLPLVRQSLRLLLDQLEPRDRVTLVTYAGDSELKLPATPVSERAKIATAIDSLISGGSTNGSGGITTAYQQARAHFVDGGVNRVILATDGDFNVGLTSPEELQTLIAKEAKSGVYLSVLAYGSDNLKDPTAELLADKGNGNYAYIDSLSEARRALVTQMQGTLVTIAKDVKIQVEFNPAQVARYRLLGYENRALANQDFNDDTKDAGEIGAGHSVTALYEIVPAGSAEAVVGNGVDPLKYQSPGPQGGVPANPSDGIQLAFVNARLEDVLVEYERLTNRHILRDASIAARVTVVQPKDAKFNATEAAAFIKRTLLAQDLRIWEYRPGIDKVSFSPVAHRGELLTVKLRCQQPEGNAPSQLMEIPVRDSGTPWAQASANFRWTAAVAGYGLLLGGSSHAGDLSWDTVRGLAAASKGSDPDGFRGEFLQLVEKAAGLAGGK